MKSEAPATKPQQLIGLCLLCNWEPNYEKGLNLPGQHTVGSNLWICLDCEARAKTVTSFGLSVDELHKAADLFKSAPLLQERVEALEKALRMVAEKYQDSISSHPAEFVNYWSAEEFAVVVAEAERVLCKPTEGTKQ